MVPPVVGLLNVTAVVDVLLHTTWLATAFIVAVGFTVMVKVIGVPLQVTPPLVKAGVTVMVAVTGAVVALVAVKLAILPVPLAARPMDGVLLVQLYTVEPNDEYMASTYRRLPAPKQGSPKTPLFAPMVTLFWPIANPDTMAILFAA